MRSHAKAPTAGSNRRQATGLGRFVRGAFVGRGASDGATGSGALSYPRSRRRRLGLLSVAALAFAALVVVATAFAAKDVVLTIGTGGGGNAAGQFANNNGLDVNDPSVADGATDPYGNSTDGYIYVADEDNARVEVFDSEHNFVFTFGGDVNATETANVCPRPGNPGDDCAKSGDEATQAGGYFDDLQDVAIDQSDGSVYVMDEDNARVQKFAADGEFLWTVGNNVNADGLPVPDLCLAGDTCQAGTNDVAENGFTTNSIGHLAVDPNAPHNLYVADEDHFRIQVFDSSGSFVRMYGHGVDDGTNAPQVCTSGCQNGISGAALGQFDEPNDVDIDDEGRIYVSDDDNDTVTRFDDGVTFATPTDFAPAVLGGFAPGRIDIDPGPAAGSADDRIYVLRTNAGDTEVVELDESGALLDTHMQGAGIDINSSTAGGLSLNRSLGEIYVSDDSPDYVYVLDDPLPPVGLVMNAITTKTTTTATFSGTVNPLGGLVEDCDFQYSTDQVEWTDVPELDCESLDPDGGAQSVSEEVVGLSPDTHYFVRLRASRPFVPGSTTVSMPVRVFDTDVAVPEVTKVGAIEVSDTSARMVATIDPNGSETGYYFNYGTTPALGTKSPAVNVGGGSTPVIVTQKVTGLSPNTTYYFRLVAGNIFGETQSAGAKLLTRAAAPAAPAERAYEQISPVEKNGGDAFGANGSFGGDVYVSANGNRIAYTANASFGDNPTENYFTVGIYYADRTAGGWESDRIVQPPCIQSDNLPLLLPHASYVSRDFSHASFPEPEGEEQCTIPPLDPNAPADEKSTNLYRHDLKSPPGFDLINPQHNPPNSGPFFSTQFPSGAYSGASDDQTRIVFRSRAQQTPDAAPENGNASTWQLFEWQEHNTPGCTSGSSDYNATVDACLSLVSKDPTGNAFATHSEVAGSAIGNSGDFGNGNNDAMNAVSSDASRVFFHNQPTNNCSTGTTCQLYMHDLDADATYHIGQSECTSSCGSVGGTEFAQASPTGDAVLFTSPQKLTDTDPSANAGEDIFLYLHSANPATDPNLTAVSIDDEPLDGTSSNAQGVVGASDDLKTVFFVANGQLVDNAPLEAGPKLYRWRWNSGSPQLEYLANMHAADADQNWVFERANGLRRERRVTADGGTLIVESRAQLDPVADQDSDDDVYRWTQQRGFECVSCQLPDVASSGPSNTGNTGRIAAGADTTVSNEMSTAMTNDGKRIYFQTQDALVLEDTNSPCAFDATLLYYPCTDVYEWNDGVVSLITPGDETDGALTDVILAGVTPSGSDVLFATRQQLVGWDLDTNKDVYTARVGGGFPEPDVGAICEGEACRGAGSEAPETQGAGTAAFEGPGNLSGDEGPDRCKRLARSVRRLSTRAKRLRRAARRAAKAGDGKRARRFSRTARRYGKAARRRSATAKRCRRAARRGGRTSRRAVR